MANPALKKREEVITDLEDAGFSEKGSRGIVQAVVDTTASLDLATRADLRRVAAALNGKLNALKKDMATLKVDQDKKLDEVKRAVDRWHRAIFWGLIIGFTVLSLVLR